MRQLLFNQFVLSIHRLFRFSGIYLFYAHAATCNKNNASTYYEPFFGSFDDMDLYTGLVGNNWVDAVFGKAGTSFSTTSEVKVSGAMSSTGRSLSAKVESSFS